MLSKGILQKQSTYQLTHNWLEVRRPLQTTVLNDKLQIQNRAPGTTSSWDARLRSTNICRHNITTPSDNRRAQDVNCKGTGKIHYRLCQFTFATTGGVPAGPRAARRSEMKASRVLWVLMSINGSLKSQLPPLRVHTRMRCIGRWCGSMGSRSRSVLT